MNTISLITLIKKQAPEWSEDNIRELINEIQRMMLNTKPLGIMRVIDNTTGVDPIITTVAGTLEYTIDITNGYTFDANVITSVYKDTATNKVTCSLIPKTISSGAKIIFAEDPGNDTYSMVVYRVPAEIEIVTEPLEVPETYHISILMEGVLGLIEKIENGGVSQRWEKFEQVLLPKFFTNMNIGSFNTPKHTPLRGY